MGGTMMSPKAVQFLRKALGLEGSTALEVTPLSKRGSDRAFFRVAWPPNGSVIVIDYDPQRQENCYYASIAHFLEGISVPVPHVLGHDPSNHLMVTEDLGETDLWSFRGSQREIRDGLYRQTLSAMQRFHSFPEKEFPTERVLLMEPFDGQLYKWERDYFRDHFVEAVCHIRLDLPFSGALETELSQLADRLMAGPRCLVHRDLQSQNVMIHGGKPVFIDFQGMRFGSPFYDLGSFLCDPYVELTHEERIGYLSAYYGLSDWGYDWDAFRDLFWDASAQRLMQALGAYGFLGLSKGLTAFLEYIPAGLNNIESVVGHATGLPLLRELLGRCRAVWTERMGHPKGVIS
jgi:hypothetical protein